jgi:hypothetical protein
VHLIEGHSGLLAFLAGLVAIGGAAVVAIGGSAPRLSGYNDAPVQIDVATVAAGARACQPGGASWEGTRAVRLSGRLDGGVVSVMRAERDTGARPAAGPWTRLRAGEEIVLPLPRANATSAGERICVSNRGPTALVLSGVAVGPDAAVVVTADGDESVGPGRFRVEGLTSDRPESGWTVADRVPERLAAGTGVAAAPWVAGAGLAIALLAVGALLARRGEVRDAG